MAMELVSHERVASGVKQEKKSNLLHRITVWMDDYGNRKGKEILSDMEKGYFPYV